MSKRVYEVKISDPGRLLTLKNRVVRTPTKFRVSELDLKGVKLKIHDTGIVDFSVSLVEERSISHHESLIKNEPLIEELEDLSKEEPLIEKLEDSTPKTILEELLEDE